jgi:L-asparaginase
MMLNETMTKVLVLTTGGTIEKTYDESDGTLFNRETVIKNAILSRLRLPYTFIEVKSIMSKDSLDMTDHDRKFILDTISFYLSENTPMVIIHGTDTMEVTARFCYEKLQDLKVPIVFTGAMKPLGFEDSDAMQNVVEALYAAKITQPGVYISFHNQLFPLPKVRKNKAKRTFEFGE